MDCGELKKSFILDSLVNRAWSDSSLPRSQVNERQSWAGTVFMVSLSSQHGAVRASNKPVVFVARQVDEDGKAT